MHVVLSSSSGQRALMMEQISDLMNKVGLHASMGSMSAEAKGRAEISIGAVAIPAGQEADIAYVEPDEFPMKDYGVMMVIRPRPGLTPEALERACYEFMKATMDPAGWGR